ncbi:MAG: Rrf2 family transcriptional regulator [Phycisphaeraceae bacterium]
MLSLTRKADYALVATVYLARRRAAAEGPVSAREIAEQFDLPLALLMNVLKQLAGAGLLRSTRGVTGGYELAVEAEAVSVLDVVEAVAEGEADAPDAPVLGRLRGRLDGFLRQMTVAGLLREADETGGETVVSLRTAGR